MENLKKKKTEKKENLNPFSNNKYDKLIKSDKPYLYFKNIFKQNGPVKELNNSLQKIAENGSQITLNIQSIFSNEEKKKKVMNILKNMREKRTNQHKVNFSQNLNTPDKYKSTSRNNISPNNNLNNTNYDNLNYNNYNPNSNYNVMEGKFDINVNEEKKQLFIDQYNINTDIQNRNNNDNYNKLYKTDLDNNMDINFESYRTNQSEKKVLLNNLKIAKFKIYFPSKKKKTKISNFNFSIKSKNKPVKKFTFIIQSNSLNINSQIRNSNENNNIKKMNNNFNGIKILEIENGKETSIIEIDASNKMLKEEIKQKKIFIQEKEYKLIDLETIKKEKEKAIEDAFKVRDNLLYNENEKNYSENKKEEEPIEITLGSSSSKNKSSNKKEDKKNEFENEKNNTENYYKKLIEDSLKEQEIKFNQIKKEEINKLISELNLRHENEMKNALEQQKKIYEQKIEKILDEKGKQIPNIKSSKNKQNTPSEYIRKMLKILEEEKEKEKEREKIKNQNLMIQNNQFEIQDSYTTIFKMAKTNINPDVVGIINKKPQINYKKIKPTFLIFKDLIDENILSQPIDNWNLNQKKKELRMKIKSKKK